VEFVAGKLLRCGKNKSRSHFNTRGLSMSVTGRDLSSQSENKREFILVNKINKKLHF
jgi:hypothetical protein